MHQTRLFREGNAKETQAAFFRFLGENNLWFGKLLYGIKEGWTQNNCDVTEIRIAEMKPVSVAILKAFIPCPVKEGNEEFQPTKYQIEAIVERFTDKKTKVGNSDALVGESIDFAFQVFGLGIYRVNFSYSSNGSELSIRYLPYNIRSLDRVGYPKEYVKYLERMVEKVTIKSPPVVSDEFFIQVGSGQDPIFGEEKVKPKLSPTETFVPKSGGGLILHIGPTGSGKTTAMASEIEYLANKTASLILTYEDPIEYPFIGTLSPVSSFELGRDIKQNADFTLPEVVRRHALRKNPAVIMFGEMRTAQQMRMVVDMANSGHWVLASMHGQYVFEGIGVLAALFKDEPHMLANSIKGAIAHRLVTNSEGKVLPLFEIFIPDPVRVDALSKGDINEIKRVFKEDLGAQSISFKKSLELLRDTQQIKDYEMEGIEKMAFGNDKLKETK